MERPLNPVPDEICISIRRDTDIVLACQKGRALAAEFNLSGNDQVVVVIAISEVARNILLYAGRGEIILTPVQQNHKQGIMVVARDNGPGMADIELVLQDGYSTGGGLGLGLSGAKRLMDEFEIMSKVGRGTTIIMKKWGSKLNV
ncbi:MAG: anti-sigma regulatory factor [Anaerolineae bacterium]|nr:anti-sigma regulatory factor [Anaerolineae bacterium]